MKENDDYLMDGHKLLWHLDRVVDWQNGKRIAPLHIDVGLSKGCNIRCRYCFGAMQGNLYKNGKDAYFPRDALMRYMRDAGETGVRSMGFIGEAEPTLNPHLYDAIVEGTNAGVDIALGTNGVLFDRGRDGERALEHLIWLRFNLSAATDNAYRYIHGSKDFEIVIRNIKFCVDYKREKDLDTTIGLQMVLTPENVDQVVPLAQLGHEIGVDYLVVKQCSDSSENTLGIFDRLDEYDSYSDRLREAEAMSTDDYRVIIKWKKIGEKAKRSYGQCVGVPFLLYSSGNGRLYPCGMFFDHREEEFRMGDLVKQSFKEILESERYWNVVDRVRNEINVAKCYSGCRTHAINGFVWKISQNIPQHVNFI